MIHRKSRVWALADLRQLYSKDSVGSLMHRVPEGMTLLSSLSVREAVRELSLASYRVPDPCRSGGIFLIRDAQKRILGHTTWSTLIKMNAGASPADALSCSSAAAVDEGGAAAKAPSATALEGPLLIDSSVAEVGTAAAPGREPVYAYTCGGEGGGEGAEPGTAVVEAAAVVQSLKPLESLKQHPADLLLLSVLQPFVHVLRVDDSTDELLRLQMIAVAPVIPVIDAEGILVGVVRPRDAMLLMQTRISQLLSGDGDSYSKSTVLFLVKKRIVWLLLLAVLNFGVSDGGRLRAMVRSATLTLPPLPLPTSRLPPSSAPSKRRSKRISCSRASSPCSRAWAATLARRRAALSLPR
jgi:hypothetical protein